MSVIQVLTWIVLATLMLAIATQLSEQKVGARLPPEGSQEGFTSGGPMDALGDYLGWTNASEESADREGPMKGRGVPDLLLESAPAKKVQKINTNQTSQQCFESDFQEQSNKVGSYVQRTNNYKRAGPDSCSAPVHELVGSFYQPVTLPTA
jgi:hypothetical protein